MDSAAGTNKCDTQSPGSSVRINSAGRPIHGTGRFMTYEEARSKGWVNGSAKSTLREPSTQDEIHLSHRLEVVRETYAHVFNERSLTEIANHQHSVGLTDFEKTCLSLEQQDLVQGTSFSWFKSHGDLKQVVVMLHGWALVMNPNSLGEASTGAGQDGLASLVSAGYDVVIPELPANPKAVGSSKDVQWAQGVCGPPTDKDTYKNPANHGKMAAYLEALLKFFGLTGGTHKPIVIASSYSGYFVSAWLMGLDKDNATPRDAHIAALVLLAGASTAEGNFLFNYNKKPWEQTQDELSAIDEQNWNQLVRHQADFTALLQQSLVKTPVLYMRGSNDLTFPASAAAYLGLERNELQMIRRSSEQESFGQVDYSDKPLYRWEVNQKAGYAPKVMAVLKDAPHSLYFTQKAGTLQPLRDEINSFLCESLERKRDRSADILAIPSQAEAASSIGNAVPLYAFVPTMASIATASQVGEVKNSETCIILKEDGHGHFYVQHGDVEGWAEAEQFCHRKYRLLLNLKLCQAFEDVYRKTLEAISSLGCCTVLRAFSEGRTYAHLTLNYDFEVDREQLKELIVVLETFAAANERVPLRMKGADAFGASVIFLDVDREHQDYNRAMKLHVDLVDALQGLNFTKSKKDEKDIHWHATVAYKDFPADKKDEVLKCVRDASTPVDCYFDNVTIMAKVGPSQAYAGTAKAAMSFPLRT